MKIKYNWEFDRYVTEDGKVLRYSKGKDKLVLCKLTVIKDGYLLVSVKNPKVAQTYVHRLVFETFVGEIPQGYEIDHINTVRDDNRIENLRVVTKKENQNNPLTRKHKSDSKKGNKNALGKPTSVFGDKFYEHFGISYCENPKLYKKEHWWYYNHNKTCRWEMNTDERN